MLHQDAFAPDYQEDEYMLLRMAIMCRLRGKEVRVIGKNRSALGGDKIQCTQSSGSTWLNVQLVAQGCSRLRFAVVTTATADRAMIDEFLSIYDFSATYEVHIDAPASVVYQRLLRSDFNDLWLVRLLMTIRTGRLHSQNRVPRDLHERLQGTGFVILDAVREQELVIGVAGRFWRPDGGRCLDLNASNFVEFSRPGCAKAAWNFKLTPQSPQSTVLSTETRIKCFGSAAFWKFRLYWTLVKPFSGLIREAILKQVKTAAESAFTAT